MRGFGTLFLGNVASKLLGVFREIIFAACFGTSSIAASYRAAQGLFILTTHGVVGEALNSGVMPLYKQEEARGRANAHAIMLVGLILSFSVGILIAVGLSVFCVPLSRIVGGKDPAVQEMTSTMLRIVAWAAPFYISGNFLGFIEASYGRFGALSLRPSTINIIAILGATIAWLFHDAVWLAFATPFGFLIFFLITAWQVAQIKQIDWRTSVSWRAGSHALRVLARNSAPLALLPVVAQSNALIERVMAATIGAHVLPSLDYARFVTETATTMTAVPLGIIAMASHGGRRGPEASAFARTTALRLFVFMMPLSLFVARFSTQVVEIIFKRGAFDYSSVATTSSVLVGSAAGLSFSIAGYFCVKALNAQIRNGEALAITVFGAAANIVFNIAFSKNLGPIGIGIGASINGIVIATLCAIRLGFGFPELRIVLYTGAMAVAYLGVTAVPIPVTNVFLLVMWQAIILAITWAGFFLFVPEVKSLMGPVLARVFEMARRNRGEI